MLAKLLEQYHRQQVRPGEAARRDMERRRRLGGASHCSHENFSRTVWMIFTWGQSQKGRATFFFSKEIGSN